MSSSDHSSKIDYQIDVGDVCLIRGHEEKYSPTIVLFFSIDNLWEQELHDQEIFE